MLGLFDLKARVVILFQAFKGNSYSKILSKIWEFTYFSKTWVYSELKLNIAVTP